MLPAMDERERRVGLNEAVFREVNERIREVGKAFAVVEERLDLICECGQADCAERIQVPATEYERLRSVPTHFAIVPGHEISEVETLIERCAGYDVVEKKPGPAAKLARDTDPRS
jgi:hypothetical protein